MGKIKISELPTTSSSPSSTSILPIVINGQTVKRGYSEFCQDVDSMLATDVEAAKQAAQNSATQAANSASQASTYASRAATQASNASDSASAAANSANIASNQATRASTAYENTQTLNDIAKSWAVGPNGSTSERGTDGNNSHFWYTQCKSIAQGLTNGLLPLGSIYFSEIPSDEDVSPGFMYNIVDSFTTDSRFVEGSGITVPANTNIFYTADGKWDIFSPSTGQDLSGFYVTAGKKSGTSIGSKATAEGNNVTSSGAASHAEGKNTFVNAEGGHVEGCAEGSSTSSTGLSATGKGSHVEGYVAAASAYIRATKPGAHAEGYAENAGDGVLASGYGSHAEGADTTASGNYSHAQNLGCVASGSFTHAGGNRTVAGYTSQTAVGKYNSNKTDTLFEVGNGSSASSRKNAFEVTSDGYIRTKGRTDKIAFGIDSNGNYGYIKDGADTVIPFKNPQGTKSITANGDYDVTDFAQASVNVPSSSANLQAKTTVITPEANWSSQNTKNAVITPDSGYDGMSQVNVAVPMLRDNTLLTASTVSTPSTVYNGDTAQSNSQKMLRVAPTKDGMSYTGSYLYLGANSHLGNATAEDVASGKTFSSASGIQLTGTGSGGGGITPTGTKSITSNGTYDVTNFAYAAVNVQASFQLSLTKLYDNDSTAQTSYKFTSSYNIVIVVYHIFYYGVTTKPSATISTSGSVTNLYSICTNDSPIEIIDESTQKITGYAVTIKAFSVSSGATITFGSASTADGVHKLIYAG